MHVLWKVLFVFCLDRFVFIIVFEFFGGELACLDRLDDVVGELFKFHVLVVVDVDFFEELEQAVGQIICVFLLVFDYRLHHLNKLYPI